MRVAIVHNEVAPGADPSTADVLDEVACVEEALLAAGARTVVLPVTRGRVWESLGTESADVVFNLVESEPGRPWSQAGAAAVLELLGIPFTGSPSAAVWLTTDKIATRAVLAANGLAVAPGGRYSPELLGAVPGPWIVKPALEDASLGLEGDPVCRTVAETEHRAAELQRRFPGQAIVLESFLSGRELNVSLLASSTGLEPLPVAEIAFVGYSDGEAPLVTYEAKWHPGSEADRRTRRCFLGPADDALALEAVRIASAAAAATGVAGYARVDLRLDAAGRPCVLEVNANPCLSADAGFMAAAERAGLSPRNAVERIVAAALTSEPIRA